MQQVIHIRFHRMHRRFPLHATVRYLAISLLLILISLTGRADEKVRIAGMGGVKIAMNAADAGPFGNPAALLDIEANNLSVALSIENYRYEELPETPHELLLGRIAQLITERPEDAAKLIRTMLIEDAQQQERQAP